MSRRDSSGPAFPRTGFYPDAAGVHNDDLAAVFSAATTPQSGMTLRDWFAGHALTGLLAWSPTDVLRQYDPDSAAAKAYRMADAMLAARDQAEAGPVAPSQQSGFDFDLTHPDADVGIVPPI